MLGVELTFFPCFFTFLLHAKTRDFVSLVPFPTAESHRSVACMGDDSHHTAALFPTFDEEVNESCDTCDDHSFIVNDSYIICAINALDSSKMQCGVHDCESAAMREALENIILERTREMSEDSTGISLDEIKGFLMEPSYKQIAPELHLDVNNENSVHQFIEEQNEKTDNNPTLLLWEKIRGVPQMPFYLELSRRLNIINKHNNHAALSDESNAGLSSADDPPFLPASHFHLKEQQCLSKLIPPPPKSISSVEECTAWLQNAGYKGISALLGCRRTIGSISHLSQQHPNDSCTKSSSDHYLFPPSIPQLIISSRKMHKPNTKSKLTVAARALAKHAHRGEEGFFGTVKGSETEKNKQAECVVERLISEAAWINIHCFGGVNETRPVMEVRTADGYGARWSAVWTKDAFSPEDVEFRGFLEPQMDDGHQQSWKH